MLQRISAVGWVSLTLLVAWLFVEVRSLRQARAAPPIQLTGAVRVAQKKPADENGAAEEKNDLAGTITDSQGKPLTDVHVLVILKTWPNDRYRQQDFAAKTDRQGRFRFAKLAPVAGQRAIHLAAVKDGYALTALYELRKAGEELESDALKLQLDDAVPLKLKVRDGQGRPAAKARVIPFSRQATGGEQQSVYFQAAKPIEVVADDEGVVPVGVFRRGDKAEIYIALPGKEWEQQSVVIPEKGDFIEVSSKETVDNK